MRLLVGILFLSFGIGWLIWIAVREKNPRTHLQVIYDFFTGSPFESIFINGFILMGIILIIAHLVA